MSSINLLESANRYLDSRIVSQVSNLLDESQQHTQKTFEGALSALLSGLIQKSSEPSGAILIMDLLGELMPPEEDEMLTPIDNLMNQLAEWLINQQESSSVMQTGATLVQGIFEEKSRTLTNRLAAYSGVRQFSSATITNLTASVLLSLLSEQMSNEYHGLSGLTDLLNSQGEYVASAFPSGLGSLLASDPELNKLNELIDTVPSPIRSESIYSEEDSSPGMARWLLWLLVVLGGISLSIIIRAYN
ncbi:MULTISPECIES: DUF937 domain-containing protein [unclassified Spirosoma]|uniref:DUF937 domain-containing protein n=1 Tax=unclassified Spirosoma TaxID=2621999 RepID=UPI000962D45B|nr:MULTISPECIES: DUF937 domain-containing protein [unclassified Spirosoma]MBN8821772.1 DUF937 domain-containing protein [Spirosoma sp.]OJW80736.1 MAG: hypothetical protein BGO59_35330 [Spirosoma sp. 48-14]